MFPCRLCTMIFHSDHLLVHHMYKVHSLHSDADDTIASLPLDFSSKVKVKEQPNSPSPSSTPAQQTTYANRRRTKLDLKDVEKFSCAYCPSRFPTTALLRQHLKDRHAGHEPLKLRKFLETTRAASDNKDAVDFTGENVDKSRESPVEKNESRVYAPVRETPSSMDKLFSCDECTMKFAHHNSLQKHLLHHARNRPHQCDVCKLKFAVKEQLSRHERTHKRLHACAECDLAFSNQSELSSHQRIHSVLEKYRSEHRPVNDCDVGSSENSSNDSSKGHEWTLFMITDKMNKIIERELKIEPDSPESSSSCKTSSSTDEKLKSTALKDGVDGKCTRHKFHIRKRRLLESHLNSAGSVESADTNLSDNNTKRRHLDCDSFADNTSTDSTTNAALTLSSQASPLLSDIPKPNFAMTPNFMPFSQSDLHNLITKHFYSGDESGQHRRAPGNRSVGFSTSGIDGVIHPSDALLPTHSSILRALKAKVDPIDRRAAFESSLYRPESSHSDSIADSCLRKCDDCGVAFINSQYSRRVDLPSCDATTPRHCDECLARYRSSKRKLNVHSNEKPFRCKFCPMKFRLRHNCEKHMCAHMSPHTEHSPYVCGYCAASFPEHEQLRRHLRIHSDDERRHECSICLLKFQNDEALNSHMTVSHTGDQPYSCCYCKQTFAHAENLQRHLTIHTQPKPYSCVICNARFSRTRELKRHVSSHQGDNGQRYESDCSSEDVDEDDEDDSIVHTPMELGQVNVASSFNELIKRNAKPASDNTTNHQKKSRRRKSEPVKRTAMLLESDEDDDINESMDA
ncbi:uncharacterized protein LOC141908680 isoform X2 [Tubulanus polymorphus]